MNSRLLADVSLRQREWDHADGQKQKHVKGTSNKVRFNGGVLFFHFCGPRDVTSAKQSGAKWGSNPGQLYMWGTSFLAKSAKASQAIFYNLIT